jgi:hypothetical protein
MVLYCIRIHKNIRLILQLLSKSKMIPQCKKNKKIFIGTANIDNTNILSTENNHYERIGNVVAFSFTATTKKQFDNNSRIFTGLPGARQNTRFTGVITGVNGVEIPLRFAITTKGEVVNAYSTSTIPANKIIEGHVVYICQ